MVFQFQKRFEKKKLVSIRYDLMPGESNKGGSNNPFYLPKEKAEEDWAIHNSRAKSFSEMATRFGMKTSVTYRLYVIETHFQPKTLPRIKSAACMLARRRIPVDERIEQHRLGPAYPWEGRSP